MEKQKEKEMEKEKEEHHIDKKQMEKEMVMEKQKEKQKEEYHIDKKQKTENQQDEVVKVRRPRKLSRNDKLYSGVGIPWDLFFGCRRLDILMHPPACYRSPPYETMYGYEASKILLQGDRKKLRESTASSKW